MTAAAERDYRATDADEREYRVPDQPRLGTSLRKALVDFYFNSWRLVPANGLWGVVLLLTIGALFVVPLAAPVLAIVLAVPAAGIFRLAALIVREESVSFRDALTAWRTFLRPALVAGGVLVGVTSLLAFNLVIGVVNREPLLWVIATFAGWALLAAWAIALPFWALMTDPIRQDEPLRERLRLAALLVIISPGRFGMLLLLMLAVLVVSAILFAALLTISIAYMALVVTRYTLPAADRFEQRRTHPLAG